MFEDKIAGLVQIAKFINHGTSSRITVIEIRELRDFCTPEEWKTFVDDAYTLTPPRRFFPIEGTS